MNQTAQMFGQMMCMPVTMMEMFMRSLQQTTQCGDSMWPAPTQSCPQPVVPIWQPEPEYEKPRHGSCDDGWNQPAGEQSFNCPPMDCCGDHDHHHSSGSNTVKLIEYSLATVRRGHQEVLEYGQKVVSDCTSRREIENEVICAWSAKHPDQTCKDLRIFTRVLDCWCKPEFDFEERQVDALHEIRNAIAKNA